MLRFAKRTIDEKNTEFLIEKNAEGLRKIYIKDIVYIETNLRNTLVHTSSECIRSNRTMKQYLALLGEEFVRCHTSYIVHMHYVERFGSEEWELSTGKCIPVSRYRRTYVKEKMARYLGDLIRE